MIPKAKCDKMKYSHMNSNIGYKYDKLRTHKTIF